MRSRSALLWLLWLGCATGWQADVDSGLRLASAGRFEEASLRYASAVEKADASGGDSARYNARVAFARHLNTFNFVADADREAEMWREADELASQVFGPTHPAVVEPTYRRAEALVEQGQRAEAQPFYERALRASLVSPALVPETTAPRTRWQQNREALGLAIDPETLAAEMAALRGEPAELGGPRAAAGRCLRPNIEDEDGVGVCIHVTPTDMPLRVALAPPPVPAKDGSRSAARAATVEALRRWERALQPRVPWFALEIVEKDRSAAVQVRWKRRIAGPYAGFGRLKYRLASGALRVGGRMEITMQPGLPASPIPLKLEELQLLVTHEFGHVLGLGHSLDEDSAMNYSWHTRDRVFVTEVDVADFVALIEQPNGVRTDGKQLSTLAR